MTDTPSKTTKLAERRLGRGLSSLLPGADRGAMTRDEPAGHLPLEHEVRRISIASIAPSAFQPRRIFNPEEMESLTRSVAEKGIIQPILVRPKSVGRYEIIAGERRWRAAQAAKLHEIPVVVRDLDDRAALEFALIENLQRDNLTALEEAQAFHRLMDQFGHRLGDVLLAVGKSRSHVANTLRLLALPEPVKALLDAGQLTAGHARTLLGAVDPERLARDIVAKGLNVRQAERLVKKQDGEPSAAAGVKERTAKLPKDADLIDLERRLSDSLGLAVRVDYDGQGGKLTIAYKSLDQLDELIERLLVVPGRAREATGSLADSDESRAAQSNIASFPGDKTDRDPT
ncbi:MAG: ParB/RepB/Spo0J family partition protein [Alphaproteobacteria bacterium]|nr:ParB/RepB/Spo0J family partition protein [Alphaproteobacteria bacterium]